MVNFSTTYGRKYAVVREYKNINVRAKGRNRKSHIKSGEKGKYNVQNMAQADRNSVKTIQELIENNFDDSNSMFVTLTFSNEAYVNITSKAKSFDMQDVYKECNKEFRKFIKRVGWKYKGVCYVAVPELQNARMVIHYHLVWNIVDMDNPTLTKLWQHGSTNIKAVYDEENLAKYMCKDKTPGRKKCKVHRFTPGYLASRGLQRNIKVESWKEYEKSYLVASEIKEKGQFVQNVTYESLDGQIVKNSKYKFHNNEFEIVQPAVKKA